MKAWTELCANYLKPIKRSSPLIQQKLKTLIVPFNETLEELASKSKAEMLEKFS